MAARADRWPDSLARNRHKSTEGDFVMRSVQAIKWALPKLWIASLTIGGLALYQGWTPIRAQPQPPAPAGGSTEVKGTVQSMNTAPRGEVDGATLDNGTSLHWPPHMQDRFTNAIKVGDQVRATGRLETRPRGESHFEVQSVTNVRTNATVDNPDFANEPPRPGRGPHERGRRMPRPPAPPIGGPAADARTVGPTTEVHGTVQRMTTARRGEIDGAVLDGATWLHWPPHLQDRFTSLIKPGDQVRATGRTETGPAGDTHFEVQKVTNVQTNATAENSDFNGPSPGLAAGPQSGPAINCGDVDRRLQDLQNQIDVLRREIDRLRR
jgi:hypothetical protein